MLLAFLLGPQIPLVVVDEAFTDVSGERNSSRGGSRFQVLGFFIAEIDRDVIFYRSRKFLLTGCGAGAARCGDALPQGDSLT